MYEALQRLAWKEFHSWIEKFPDKNLSVQQFFNGLYPLYNDLCQREFDAVMKSQAYSEFIVLYVSTSTTFATVMGSCLASGCLNLIS